MKGFTLVEVMGVLIILGIISLITVPVISNVLKENKKELYEIQIKNIEESARNFVAENLFSLNLDENKKIAIKIGNLKQLGYLEDFVFPSKGKDETDNTLVLIENENIEDENVNGNILYTVCIDSDSCDLTDAQYYGE